MSPWLVALGVLLIAIGGWQLVRNRKYMHYLKTSAGASTPPFTLQAVYSSWVVTVMLFVAGFGVILLYFTNR